MPTGHRGPPETDSIRVAYEGYLGPATWAIVHWFKVLYTGSASLADQEYVNQHLATPLHDNLLANACSNDLHLTTVRSTVFLTSGERIRKVSVMDAVGGISSSSEPSSIAYLIDWATTDGRRGGKPRTYLPGVPENAMIDTSRIAASSAADRATNAMAYVTAAVAISHGVLAINEFVDMSFVDGGAYRTVGHAYPILGASVRQVVGHQRRR